MDLVAGVFALEDPTPALGVADLVVEVFGFTELLLAVVDLGLVVPVLGLVTPVLALVVALLGVAAFGLATVDFDFVAAPEVVFGLVAAPFGLFAVLLLGFVVVLFDLAAGLLLFEVDDFVEACLPDFALADPLLVLLLPDDTFWEEDLRETPGLLPAEALCDVNLLRVPPGALATFLLGLPALVDAAPRAPLDPFLPPNADALLVTLFVPCLPTLPPPTLEDSLEMPDAILVLRPLEPPPDTALLVTLLTLPAIFGATLAATFAPTLVMALEASEERPRASRCCSSSGMGAASAGTIAKRAARAARPVDTRIVIWV